MLRQVLPPIASVLEIAAGTGQHAAHFAAAQPRCTWQPTDADETALPLIDARCAALPNVRPALRLDVLAWPEVPDQVDAVYAANLLHISPWATCSTLMHGAVVRGEFVLRLESVCETDRDNAPPKRIGEEQHA